MSGSPRAWSALRSLLVFTLPFAATLPRFRNAFVFDDVFMIRSDFIFDLANLPRAFANRTMIASSLDKVVGRPGMDTYRPIPIASFFWDAALSGRDPWSYHLTSAVLHGLVCVLLLKLLRLLAPELRDGYRTCLAAWFGLSPWLAEAHVFINGRSDPLLALFFLLALLFMWRALVEERPLLAALSGLSLFAALLSKEIAVVLLPFVAAVPVPAERPLRARAAYVYPLFVALGVYLLARYLSLAGLRSHSDGAQLALAISQLPLVLLDGCLRIVLPSPYFLRNMRDDYAALGPGLTALAWLALAILLGVSLRYLRRAYSVVWGLGIALAALAPTAMISTSLWPGFGRYLYVPTLGLAISLAALLDRWLRREPRMQRLAAPLLGLWVAVSGALLLDATLGFQNETTLYERALAARPEQAWTHGFLGMSLRRERRCPQAIGYLNRAATLAPEEARYAIRLGQCLLEAGAFDAAERLALEGRKRFSGQRSEAGFLMVAVRALPDARGGERVKLMRRCLTVDPGRSDCAELLALLEGHGAPKVGAGGQDSVDSAP